jgi:hypothetical protein
MRQSNTLASKVQISDMRHKVTLVKITADSVNALGHINTQTTTSVIVQAAIRMEQLPENSIGDSEKRIDTQSVVQRPVMTIRWTSLTVKDRIIWDGVTYDITAIDKTTHHMRFLIIQTKAVI